jgi:putative ATP-dependent endonuclease of OLD family
MRICQVEITNFRGIGAGTIKFPRHSVLFGPNNVGKSSVAEALAVLLGRERLTAGTSDWDFRGGDPKPDSRFTVVATITDFGSSNDPSDYPVWFCGERSARATWWNDSAGTLSVATDAVTGEHLAAQIAVTGRYDEDDCEFELMRYFYEGPCDPFTDECQYIPGARLSELGVFFLPSNRQWDKLLAFGSSTFMKALRQQKAVPGKDIDALKHELRNPQTKIENASGLGEILATVEKELQSFSLLAEAGHIVYRPTALDTISVLQSLVPHISGGGGLLLPFSKQGAGMVSLQAFLLVLAFAEFRHKAGQNFILIAEEPELHLHPALHRRLAHRIRGISSQSIITTHSPVIAGSYLPNESIYLRREGSTLSAKVVRDDLSSIPENCIKKLFVQGRERFYEALMGGVVLVPEGDFDHEWLTLLRRVAESSDQAASTLPLAPLTVVPTFDAIIKTFEEVSRFRPDAICVVDGDTADNDYVTNLLALAKPPQRIVQWGSDAGIEYAVAWVLEPSLNSPSLTIAATLPVKDRNLRGLQKLMCDHKKDRPFHEAVAWEILDNPQCVTRVCELIRDLSIIGSGVGPNGDAWSITKYAAGTTVFSAKLIKKN